LAEVTLAPGWATYLRVSDEDKQSPERSFAMQRHRIQEQLLVPSQAPFKHEYRDKLTGANANRADYQQMQADAEAGRFSHLGMYRADRFGRNVVEGLQTANRLMGLGIKLRVANMPTLQPETPDGFLLFLIQMGLAQREVDVMRGRILDGMEAKLRAGGWTYKAPEGYINRERQIKSGKYERWVEPDPILSRGLREGWDLLLTGRNTLDQICDELTRRGYTRSCGQPWAWTSAKSSYRHRAKGRLHYVFHNPFYAGWVYSKRYGIAPGEIRGQWKPVVTPEEFNRGVEILRRRGLNKSRPKRHFYLLRNLLLVRVKGRQYKMYGSTPTGRSKSYAYYNTQAKPKGGTVRIRCELIDTQIPDWLNSIAVDPGLVPAIREVYQFQVREASHNDRNDKSVEVKHRLTKLQNEEARLGRLFITCKIREDTYDQLRAEWQEKFRHAKANLADLERDNALRLDDLDAALALMTRLSDCYQRLEEKGRATLLSIVVKRVIVGVHGEIVDQELQSPFAYLRGLADGLRDREKSGSEQVPPGPPFTIPPPAARCPGTSATPRPLPTPDPPAPGHFDDRPDLFRLISPLIGQGYRPITPPQTWWPPCRSHSHLHHPRRETVPAPTAPHARPGPAHLAQSTLPARNCSGNGVSKVRGTGRSPHPPLPERIRFTIRLWSRLSLPYGSAASCPSSRVISSRKA